MPWLGLVYVLAALVCLVIKYLIIEEKARQIRNLWFIDVLAKISSLENKPKKLRNLERISAALSLAMGFFAGMAAFTTW